MVLLAASWPDYANSNVFGVYWSTDMSYSVELELALELAREAGAVIKTHFDSLHHVDAKADSSPVTAVDIEVNTMVGERIRDAFPADYYDGEEAKMGDPKSERVWVCDPIDGTFSFILGNPASCFMLALFDRDELVLSVNYNPMRGQLAHAVRGSGCYMNGERLTMRELADGERGMIVIDAKCFREIPDVITDLEARGYFVSEMEGTGQKAMALIANRAQGFVRYHGDYHDAGISTLLISEAGGTVSSASGDNLFNSDLTLSFGYAMGTPLVHQDIVEVVRARQGAA